MLLKMASGDFQDVVKSSSFEQVNAADARMPTLQRL